MDKVIKSMEEALALAGENVKKTTKKKPAASGTRKPGKRQEQALKLIESQPGITPPELADKMGVKGPSVYPVLRSLTERGDVLKDGKGYKAATGKQESPPEAAPSEPDKAPEDKQASNPAADLEDLLQS